MTVEELNVLITANADSYKKTLKETSSGLSNFQNKVSRTNSKISNVFNTLKTSITALGITKLISTITSQLGDAVNRLDTLNNFPRVMSNLGISSEDAQSSIKRLSEKLQGLPTTLDDASSSVQRFTSSNGNVKASTEMFLALNNAILAGGASTDIQKSALEQLSQSYAKGKPDMLEWRTAMTAMPAQLKQVAIAMGYASSDELGESLRNGTLSMNEFMTTMVKLNKEGINGFQSFEEQARNSTGGVGTSITRVKTAITRGLADIMNTIGQSNIASFFQGIARAINSVIPYVTAFVKVMGMAVSYITGLFGGKSTVAKDTNNVSNSLKSLGDSGGTASKGIDKTTGSTKKLKKELLGLAGFDEMTVLKENDSGDSGSGGSSSGSVGGVGALSNIDLSGFTNDVSNSSDKVSQIVDKMLKVLEPLRNINFEPLKNSFKNLYNAIKPLAKIISSALKSALEKVVYPIAKFTIEKGLPAFFDLLASAIKLATPIVKAFKNAGEWLLKNFLIPVGKWVGNKVIDGIKGLADGISKLADKINGSKTAQKILDGVATGILGIVTAYGIFKGAWAIGELLQTGIIAFQNAKLQASLFSSSLKTLGAEATLSSGMLTVFQTAVGLLTGKITLSQVAITLATKAQLALNAAWKAHPIAMVVSALALLTTGIIALTNHLNKGTKEQQAQAEAMKEKGKAIDELIEKNNQMHKQQQELINNGVAELNHTQTLADELRKLADENGNVEEKNKARAEFILGELNEALGTEYTMTGNQIDQYKELSESIDKQIEKKRLQIYFDAREVEYKEALIKWTDIQNKRNKAKLEQDKAIEDYEQHRSKANKERMETAINNYNKLNDEYNSMATDIRSYEDAMTANLEGNTKKAEYLLKNKESYFQSYKDLVGVSAEEQTRILKEQQDKAIQDFNNYREGYKQGLEGFTEAGLNEARVFAEKAASEYKKVGRYIDLGLETGIKENSGSLNTAWDSLQNNLINTFKNKMEIQSPSKLFKRYGEYINDGLANGLSSNSNKPQSVLGRIASNLVNSFKNKLKINSPSKVFSEFGKFTMQGYVRGIDKTSNLAVKSVKKVAYDIAMVDMTPTLMKDSNFNINRNIEVSNTLSNKNLIGKIEELTNKGMQNHVTVKIGEETFIDKIINGIKEKSFETNGEVFNI